MKPTQVAIYARVSSVQQAEAGTIDSQLAALKERVSADGIELVRELTFVDEGYSGATLVRPELERLRDLAAAGGLDRVYVHSPDRLARRYAYQILVVDELHQAGVEVVFLNRELGQSPEDDLLLQVQGMVAEYERAKILERVRRGKKHAAHQGSVNVLGTAPYGYRYLSKHEGGGEASLEIIEDESRVVRHIFEWVGAERATIGEVCRRLQQAGELTRSGKTWWDRTTVWGMLKNPTYMGSAAFGKTRVGPMRPRLRAQRGYPEQPRRAHSVYDVPADEWIHIPVAAIVSEDLFQAVQEQLCENQTRARARKRGARFLLQGLLTCHKCGYAYYGKAISLAAGKGKRRDYAYYRCTGTDAYRFGGQRVCYNKQVRTDLLEEAVWREVQSLLENPQRLEAEYRRRLESSSEILGRENPSKQKSQIEKVRAGIARMIDGYAEGLIEKAEFEPRIKRAKERLSKLEGRLRELQDESSLHSQLQLIIGRVEDFAERVRKGLATVDWPTRRELIRALVKRVEVAEDQVTVVFKVAPPPFASRPDRGVLQHCWRRDQPTVKQPVLALRLRCLDEEAFPGRSLVPLCGRRAVALSFVETSS
jgi:site-specific DNA recombinase